MPRRRTSNSRSGRRSPCSHRSQNLPLAVAAHPQCRTVQPGSTPDVGPGGPGPAASSAGGARRAAGTDQATQDQKQPPSRESSSSHTLPRSIELSINTNLEVDCHGTTKTVIAILDSDGNLYLASGVSQNRGGGPRY
ncbi:DUF6342 family protein [Kitasatospora sp. NPDC059646]|uniref:DUF6342 family protein n=1 Tax=Kitasatospora sp. NPDC059646 TaxID=3346893 RepID=UPI0036B306E3